MRILLVDDNPHGTVARKQLLEEQGYQVVTAENGESALKVFSQEPCDLVVTDYRLPSIDGVELIRRIRSVQPKVRTILLSGYADLLGLNEENTCADEVIAKSATEAPHLVRSVRRLLNVPASKKPPASQMKKSWTRATSGG
jgi:CheY-like chemotaxis protein